MKKRNILLSLLLLAAGIQTAWAQPGMIVRNNGKDVYYRISNVEHVLFVDNIDDYIEYEYVDLGLPSGTLWATMNVGAEKPEDFGDYFAWGETEPKDDYSWDTYKWMNAGQNSYAGINKYTFADGQTSGCWYSNGTFIGDNKKKLDASDDAAAANWNSKWQMPTKEQFEELIDGNNTTTAWTTQNGVEGLKVTGKNGKSIFLPGAGYISGTTPYDGSSGAIGSYWSRSLDEIYNDFACYLLIGMYVSTVSRFDRCVGRSVRPVRKGHDYVDLGLPSKTLWATCNVGAESPEEYGDYFAWGETKPKDDYSWGTYKYCEGTEKTLTKYCSYSDYDYNGFMDNILELQPEDDAAIANWGDNWQTPTSHQFRELINSNYTTAEWTTENGVNGYKITSISNGNSIFLPAAGWYSGTNLIKAGSDFTYWSSLLTVGNAWTPAYRLWNYSGQISVTYGERNLGGIVRPVRKQ